MPRAINLRRPGSEERCTSGAADQARPTLEELGALLHYALRGPGGLTDEGPLEALVAAREDAPLEPGAYRYQPDAHRLVLLDGMLLDSMLLDSTGEPARALGPTSFDEEGTALPLTVWLAAAAPPDLALQRSAAARMHRLAMTAAELDLGPARGAHRSPPQDAGSALSRRRPLGDVLRLGRTRSAGDLARALLSGSGARLATVDQGTSSAGRLEAILAAAEARCRGALIDEEAWSSLERIATYTRLPSRDVGLECRLAAGDRRVDLAAAYETRLWGAPRAGDLLRSNSAAAGDWAILDRLRAAHEQPGERGRALRESTRHLGIELDADAPPPPLRAPGIFVGLDDGTLCERVRQAILTGVPALLAQSAERSDATGLRRFVDSLPEGCVVHYFGAFPSRAAGVVRFNVEHPDLATAVDHLDELGLGGPFADAVTEAHTLGTRCVLAYDVLHHEPGSGSLALPRLGIELLFADDPHAAARSLESVLEHLQARGLCAPMKAQALRTWTGALQEAEADRPWLPPLIASARRSPDLHSVLFFSISHLKLVLGQTGGGSLTEAKAYLQVRHTWVPTG